jgi:hypothetical protein
MYQDMHAYYNIQKKFVHIFKLSNNNVPFNLKRAFM